MTSSPLSKTVLPLLLVGLLGGCTLFDSLGETPNTPSSDMSNTNDIAKDTDNNTQNDSTSGDMCSQTKENECAQDPTAGDGKDNDCDGITDEGCACNYGQRNVGVCARGVISGDDGTCEEPPFYAAMEQDLCDGEDNDCDGTIDEGCPCNFGDQNAGVCKNTITNSDGSCARPDDFVGEEGDQHCDGKDNDCDGAIDEGCSCNFNNSSEGVCKNGVLDTSNTCIPPNDFSPNEDDTKCDGKDNDCDGDTDEECRSFSLVSAHKHTCLLDPNGGRVKCWGDNEYGQATPPENQQFVSISTWAEVSCGVTRTARGECWGKEPTAGAITRILDAYTPIKDIGLNDSRICIIRENGQLLCADPDGSTIVEKTGPYKTLIPNNTDYGNRHFCAIREDNTLDCFDQPMMFPTPGRFIDASITDNSGCGILEIGRIVCWGTGNIQFSMASFFKKVSISQTDICAIQRNGTISCVEITPGMGTVQNDIPTGTFIDIAIHEKHACAVKATGEVHCWGQGHEFEPEVLFAPGKQFTSMEIGTWGICGIEADGKLRCLPHSNNPELQSTIESLLGTNTLATGALFSISDRHACHVPPSNNPSNTMKCLSYQGQPIIVSGAFSHLDSSDDHTCAATNDTILCHPNETLAFSTDITQLSRGDLHTCALLSDDTIQCQGDNTHKAVDTPSGSFKSVCASHGSSKNHSCAITQNDNARCWGNNEFGQHTVWNEKYDKIACGEESSCGLTRNGEIKCWGRFGDYGKPPESNSTFIDLDFAYKRICGLTDKGSIICWGDQYEPLVIH